MLKAGSDDFQSNAVQTNAVRSINNLDKRKSRAMGNIRFRNGDNPHLKSLHPIEVIKKFEIKIKIITPVSLGAIFLSILVV